MVYMCKGRNHELLKGCSPFYTENEIKFGRPMIEKGNKEIYYYIHLKKLDQFSFDQFDFLEKFYSEREKKMVGEGSLNNLLSDFVTGLQTGYHGTSQTMLKTISRLKDTEELNNKCKLCENAESRKGNYCNGCNEMFN